MIAFLKNSSIKLLLSNFDKKFKFNQIYLSKYFHITSIKYMVCQKMLTVEFKEVDGNICSTIKKEKKECAKFPACHSELAGILPSCHVPFFSRVYFVCSKIFSCRCFVGPIFVFYRVQSFGSNILSLNRVYLICSLN